MNQKQRKWLERIELFSQPSPSLMYAGIRVDDAPGKAVRALEQAGLISSYYPHNPAHKARYIITEAGRSALREAEERDHGN